MRQILTLLFAFSLAVQSVAAQGKGDWENVEKLHDDANLSVVLGDGHIVRGRLLSVSNTGLRLVALDCSDVDTGWTCNLNRADIERVILLHPPSQNAGVWLGGSTLAGGVTGLIIGSKREKGADAEGDALVDGLRGGNRMLKIAQRPVRLLIRLVGIDEGHRETVVSLGADGLHDRRRDARFGRDECIVPTHTLHVVVFAAGISDCTFSDHVVRDDHRAAA